MNTHDAYLATMVRRWHVNPHINQSGQTLGHHGAAAAVLAHALWPGDAELLWACIAHDLGESVTGDVPSPAKQDNPELALMLVSIEAAALDAMGIRYQPSDRLDLVDRLEAYLWMMHHAPAQRLTPEWCKSLAWIEGMALEQGVPVANAVQVILSDARKSAGVADVAPVARGWWQRVCERFKTAMTPPDERPGQVGFSSTADRSIEVCNQAWREGALANWGEINPYRPDSIEHSHWENGFADSKGGRT
jgi:hypothetical protein